MNTHAGNDDRCSLGWEFISRCLHWAEAQGTVDQVILLGSYARGEETPDSDVDILFLVEMPERLMRPSSWLDGIGAFADVSSNAARGLTRITGSYRGELPVEIGVAPEGWLERSCERHVRAVVARGRRIIYQRPRLLSLLSSAEEAALARLKPVLVEDAQNAPFRYWCDPQPRLLAGTVARLPGRDLELLLRAGIIGLDGGGYVWRFRLFYAEGLLLLSDLDARNRAADYVWLRAQRESDSWRFSDQLHIAPNSRVLDLGCGSGLNALRAAQRGASALGVDINPRAVHLAKLNRALNALWRAEFRHTDWSFVAGDRFDTVLSQPPFDPVLPGNTPRFCFDGGAHLGLQSTIEILKRFAPRAPHRELNLYTHSFATEEGTILEDYCRAALPSSLNLSFERLRRTPFDRWWQGYRERHPGAGERAPEEWRCYTAIQRYFVRVTGA